MLRESASFMNGDDARCFRMNGASFFYIWGWLMNQSEGFGKKYGLFLALAAMALVYLFPTPVDLPTQGHRLIGILVFAVIILDDRRSFLSGQCVCYCGVYGIFSGHGA